MTARQYRNALTKLDLTHRAAAELLGVSPRTSIGWITGQNPVPKAVAILLRLLTHGTISINDMERHGA